MAVVVGLSGACTLTTLPGATARGAAEQMASAASAAPSERVVPGATRCVDARDARQRCVVATSVGSGCSARVQNSPIAARHAGDTACR